MAYIPPNSTVQYFSDLGLSRDDTLYFDSVSSKNAYFANLPKIASEESMTYVSREKGIIRSSLSMSTAINIGYMRYKNTGFENFWFYAFVTDVEYINNGLTEIHFEIDNMLTYMGVFTLGECFVERQHTIGDEIGANIAEEGLDTGYYVVNETTTSGFFSLNKIVVFFNPAASTVARTGAIRNGIYSGSAAVSFDTADEANTFLRRLTDNNQSDSVVAVMMLPEQMIRAWEQALPGVHKVYITKNNTDLDGYTPRNNKLFTYPYNFLEVSNCEGQSITYKYEQFGDPGGEHPNTCDFSLYSVAGASPELLLCPHLYNGSDRYDIASNALSMAKFAQCDYTIDTYRAMLAQKNSTFVQDLLADSTNIAVGAMSGNVGTVTSGAASALSKISDTLISNAIRRPMPNVSKGRYAPDVASALMLKEFLFYKMSITKNYAEMIDNYFDMFGYAVRQHLVPNMNARPNWTYCKTIGCIVHGNMPASAARDIESMFNSGIRFWKNHNNIGNYSLNNAPA